MTVPARYLDILRRHLPGVDRSMLRLIESGYANDVVVVDERLVVRFAKHEWGAGVLAGERKVLDLAGPRLTVSVPRWESWSDEVVAYPILRGRSLEPEDFLRLSADARRRLVGEVARFLGELHAIPADEVIAAGIGVSDARNGADAWGGFMDEARRVLFPIRGASARDGMSRLFAEVRDGLLDAEGAPVLIHADLAACHLLWDGATPGLSGVIDFGCAGLDDPALDVAALLYEYGDAFLDLLLDGLPEARGSIARIRAFAALYLLQEEIDSANG